jgi:hypothetical protein
MATLTVTWPRGQATKERDFDAEDEAFEQMGIRGRIYRDRYVGDAPKSHPRFSDAHLASNGQAWIWQRQATKRIGADYGADALRHLRSWGITGSYTIA